MSADLFPAVMHDALAPPGIGQDFRRQASSREH